ncbi:hypothetical protein SEL4445_P20015 (plasmid) [Salmonella enterica subsp. enterica serovar 4,[5],12:i:-]|uniref:Uncharacterized protein n=1 Tax=Salmonella enterica subsp. enterica serovar 4,[5],12:i:- TaxID=440524 RepID=A0A8D5IG07_SALET|nr:hypothetical protein [Salmonella enterica]ECX5116182.1 hypothetical protein [Salmonella enterica subsp. enterica serovar Agona]EHE6778642.1 hypothetical protein [Salmonella enterica subsp. enterica serovar Uganda]EIU0456076.1 hypothetical protein [Salmonella enterica subsp. enterica serovar Cerro]EKC7278244.1 hypothetical protein [Salmonella enterica subsp. enterica]EBI4870685.1 hypothetical protein [Salmonella enterica]
MKMNIYKSIKYISILLLFVLFVGVGQLGQFFNSNYDVRKYALESWAGEDKERQDQVSVFIQACLIGQKANKESFKKEMELKQEGILHEPTIAICAKKYGYTELYEVVNNADTVLQSAAWPLSMVADL